MDLILSSNVLAFLSSQLNHKVARMIPILSALNLGIWNLKKELTREV